MQKNVSLYGRQKPRDLGDSIRMQIKVVTLDKLQEVGGI